MGTETPNYMSDEFDNILPDKERLSEILSFNPEKEILAISRKFCEPSERIYKNDPELRKDPLKAIEAIDWHGSSLSDIDDPVKGLVVGAAKLNTAENELKLSPKEKEVFSGYKENIHGAIGFLDTLRTKAENKVVRAVASGATIVGMVMGAAGCGDVLAKPIGETPSIPPIVEVSPTPFKPSTPINPTLTVSSKPTKIQTPTLEPTPTKTIEVTSAVPENPGFFEGIGEIVSIEKKSSDGKWYGIDSAGRAEIVYQDGEWVKFDRPIAGINFSDFKFNQGNVVITEYSFDTEGLDLNEVPASEIKRLLTPEGAPLDWGYQAGSLAWPGTSKAQTQLPIDSSSYTGRFSGYFIGMVIGDPSSYYPDAPDKIVAEQPPIPFFVFEIPNKYSRQIILTPVSFTENRRFYVFFSDVYSSGDDNHAALRYMPKEDMVDFLSSNLDNLRGQQSVIDLEFANWYTEQGAWKALSQHQAFDLKQPVSMTQFEFFNSNFEK